MLLAGCTIIDQRSFRPPPAAPGAAEIARAKLPPLPLITVRFDAAELDRAAIGSAVDLAFARQPSAIFDVVAPVPGGATREAQAAAIRQGRADSEIVANALAAAGAPRERIQLGLRADPGTPPREVRVYVR